MSEILDDIKGRTYYRLASDADSGTPDSEISHGAHFLRGVRDSVIEAVEWKVEHDGLTLQEAAEDVRDGDGIAEIADGAPSVYTYELWTQFTDLAGWTEDLEAHELNVNAGELDRIPSIALYHIAWRLAQVLLDEIADSE